MASGEKTENSLVKIFFKNGQNEFPKIGISLSKNIFKKAVDRNRARRFVSKSFENLYNKLPSGLNIVAMPKADVLQFSSGEITKSLEELLKRVDLVN